MKSIWLRLFALVLALGLLTGCGASPTAELDDAPTKDSAAEKVPTETTEDSDDVQQELAEDEISDIAVVEEAEATLYLPNDNADGFETVTETVQANPQGLVDALIAHDALPEGVTVNDFRMEDNGTETTEGEGDDASVSYTPGDSQIFLDVSQAFGDAASTTGTAGETMLLGSLVNTMLTYYNAETLTLTVEGAVLETGHNVYDTPFTMMELE